MYESFVLQRVHWNTIKELKYGFVLPTWWQHFMFCQSDHPYRIWQTNLLIQLCSKFYFQTLPMDCFLDFLDGPVLHLSLFCFRHWSDPDRCLLSSWWLPAVSPALALSRQPFCLVVPLLPSVHAVILLSLHLVLLSPSVLANSRTAEACFLLLRPPISEGLWLI